MTEKISMMAAGRGMIWASGLAVAAGLSAVLPWGANSRGPSGLVILSVLISTALIGEVAALRCLAQDRGRKPRPPEGARPPDGVVDLVTMTSVEAIANDEDPRWRRFVRLTDDAPTPIPQIAQPSAMPLLGRVALMSVFVGRDGRIWTDREIARAHRSLERAGSWLETEAVRWAAPLNIMLPDVYFRAEDDADEAVEVTFQPEGDDFGPMEANATTKAIASASRVAARLGFADITDFVTRVDARIEADVRVWLFHVLRAGRSLAIPASDPDTPGVGLAVCHSREASFPEPETGGGRVDPVTVAHELLHLFGATDKYSVPLRKFPPGSVRSRDVMRLDHERLSRLEIGPMTATEIGWHAWGPVRGRKKPAASHEDRDGRG